MAAAVTGGEDVAREAAAGAGSESTVASKNPVSTAHQTRSWPPKRRGTHGTLPQASTTSRPASCSSSAIWQPDWPLPTTRTAARRRSRSLR